MSDLQPVDKIDFWKGRIDRASREGREHYSVYLARTELWDKINATHRAIIERECAGYAVLDAGCGYGRISEWVERYTGVDFSPDFIALAKQKYPGKQFLQADLKALPFNNGQFDIAVCVSIRGMIIGNLGLAAWDEMEHELLRVAKKLIYLEYEEEPDEYYIV